MRGLAAELGTPALYRPRERSSPGACPDASSHRRYTSRARIHSVDNSHKVGFKIDQQLKQAHERLMATHILSRVTEMVICVCLALIFIHVFWQILSGFIDISGVFSRYSGGSMEMSRIQLISVTLY